MKWKYSVLLVELFPVKMKFITMTFNDLYRSKWRMSCRFGFTIFFPFFFSSLFFLPHWRQMTLDPFSSKAWYKSKHAMSFRKGRDGGFVFVYTVFLFLIFFFRGCCFFSFSLLWFYSDAVTNANSCITGTVAIVCWNVGKRASERTYCSICFLLCRNRLTLCLCIYARTYVDMHV